MTRSRWRSPSNTKFPGVAATALCLAILATSAAAAHDITYELRGPGVVRVAFHYGDGSPKTDATFQVFAPNETLPNGSGATDSAGELEFHAAQDGLWRVEVSDASGHTNRARINVLHGWPDTAIQTVPSWFVTVSLVLNVLLGLQLYRLRRGRA